MTKNIVFTGGGSAGHVIPSLPLIEALQKKHWKISYIGSYHGIERDIIADTDIPYKAIYTGKLRRYFSWQNFLDPLYIIFGVIQALFFQLRNRPDIVFSKGGFVAFPVVFSAWLLRIPVVAHESDSSPGLANRLSFPFVKKICLTFERAQSFFKDKKKTIVTGTPIRDSLLSGNKEKGFEICGFTNTLPTILVIGGSLGADSINQLVYQAYQALTANYNIIHICGKGRLNDSLTGVSGYKAFEFVKDELPHLYALSDIIVSRAGANAVYEILALNKPHIFIPLSKKASRGDQIDNANYYERLGVSKVLPDDNLSIEQFIETVENVYKCSDNLKSAIKRLNIQSGTKKICATIEQSLSNKS